MIDERLALSLFMTNNAAIFGWVGSGVRMGSLGSTLNHTALK